MASEHKTIKVYQDLTVKGDPKQSRKKLLSIAGTKWKHSVELEQGLQKFTDPEWETLVFAYEGELPACALTLMVKDGAYEVTNIVPKKVGELSIEEYNALLLDFIREIVLPASRAGNLAYSTSNADESIDDWTDENVAAALKRFSALANKSTGYSHPRDEARWFDFVVAVHLSGRKVPTDLLRQWLQTAEEWSQDFAIEMVADYETQLALLKHYDSRRPS
jgi:hypothetical protein